MAIAITIPRLGWNMEHGTFLGWLKQDGDVIRAGEMLFRLESEKAAEDIECLDGGILRIAPGGPKEGDTIPVGAVIAHLLQAGENAAPAVALTKVGIHASPRARRVAKELGVDWTKLPGSGRNGRIREQDVRAAAPTSEVHETSRVIPLSSLRRASAARLVQSAQSTVPVTLTTTVDVTNLVNLRQQFKATAQGSEPIPGLTDFFVKLTALALLKHPLLARRWAEDHLVLAEKIHIGIAVDTDAGLLVPVLHDAATLGLRQLATQTRYLIERARQGQLTTRELQGSVFTVTNLGMYGIDAFTPIINHPECAILGIGRIRRVPMFVDDKVIARDEITLSLTFDHRIVDGAPAARFLQTLTQGVENPGAWLIGNQ